MLNTAVSHNPLHFRTPQERLNEQLQTSPPIYDHRSIRWSGGVEVDLLDVGGGSLELLETDGNQVLLLDGVDGNLACPSLHMCCLFFRH